MEKLLLKFGEILMLIKTLQKTDIDLFYLVNSGVKNPLFDFLTIFISDTVYISILLISYFSFKNDKKMSDDDIILEIQKNVINNNIKLHQ